MEGRLRRSGDRGRQAGRRGVDSGRLKSAELRERGVQPELDPVDVRRRNLIKPDAFPATTAVGTVYDTGDYERSLDLVLEAADYRSLRAEQKVRRDRGDVKQLGIGVSVYVEITSGPAPGTTEWGKVEINRDGGATIYSGSRSQPANACSECSTRMGR